MSNFPCTQGTCSPEQQKHLQAYFYPFMWATDWFDHVSALMYTCTYGYIYTFVARLHLCLWLCALIHTLTQTVGGTSRISEDAAVACAGARLYAHQASGKGGQENISVDSEEGRERAEAPWKKYPSPSSRSWGLRHSAADSLFRRDVPIPVLFFTVCFTYLPQRRTSAVLITPGVQLGTNANWLEEKQLAPKVLSLFST